MLWLGRFALRRMDAPTRQTYIARIVGPGERTAAAAYTNSARYIVRPIGPALAGVAQQVTLGLPFFIAGGVKSVYDLILWAWFRRVKSITIGSRRSGAGLRRKALALVRAVAERLLIGKPAAAEHTTRLPGPRTHSVVIQ